MDRRAKFEALAAAVVAVLCLYGYVAATGGWRAAVHVYPSPPAEVGRK